MNETRSRVMSWYFSGDDTTIIASINGKKYGIFVTPAERAQVLRDVGLCAADPLTNLSWEDAAEITSTIRELVPTPMIEHYANEPEETGPGFGYGLVCAILPGVIVWGAIAASAWLILS